MSLTEDGSIQRTFSEKPWLTPEKLEQKIIPVLKAPEVDPSSRLIVAKGLQDQLDGMEIGIAMQLFGLEDPTIEEFIAAVKAYLV